VTSGTYRVQWTERQAVVTLPERIDTSNAGQIREVLLALINHGATVLVVDMALTSAAPAGLARPGGPACFPTCHGLVPTGL
jgi:hypothetical protein